MNIDPKAGHPDMDYAQAARTYNGFLRFTQITVVLLVLLLAGMATFLV